MDGGEKLSYQPKDEKALAATEGDESNYGEPTSERG